MTLPSIGARSSRGLRWGQTIALGAIVAAVSSAEPRAQSPAPAVTVTPNVNVLRNVTDPLLGDANLQRQTEPVVAISTRNPDHIMIAANDYRIVDIANDQGIGDVFIKLVRGLSRTTEKLWARLTGKSDRLGEAEEEERERAEAGSEAWVGVYITNDRGRNWTNAWMPGYPQDTSTAGKTSPAFGKAAASDPVLVSAPAGRFYLGAMAFDRGGSSKVVVSRFTDRNNSEKGSNFHFDLMREVDNGPAGKMFLDKPAIAADIPRKSSDAGACGPLYLGYTVFDDRVTDPSDKSRIMVATSLDCGNTWLAPRKVNLKSRLVQGVALAIRPSDGRLYAAYRDFAANTIYVTWADDNGYTFAPPVKVSGTMLPFDQPTLPAPDYAFRTNAFPTIAIEGDDTVYVAWQERLVADGNPRIVVTTSEDGNTWTTKRAVEPDRCVVNASGVQTCNVPAGPQVMPSLTFSRGRTMLLFYEARPGVDDVKFVASQKASYITGLDAQLLLRVAQLDSTGRGLSAIATQYQVDKDGKPIPLIATDGTAEFRGANRPNLPMYQGGLSPFIGDYISIAPSMPFVRTTVTAAATTTNASGLGFFNSTKTPKKQDVTPFWRWATESTDGPTAAFQAVWTDNRDVIFPRDSAGVPRINGDWSHYAPPGFGPCINPGSRNANVYTTEIAPRLVAGTPTSFKQLGIQRAFVIYLQNRTPDHRFYRMTIVDTADANGSFLQRPPDLNIRDVEIFPLSTVTDTVYVTGTASATQPVRVDIVEIDKQGGTPIAGGDTATVVFNSDNSNPSIETVNPSSETHTPKLFTPGNTGSSLPKISNPQLANPQLANPQLANPQLANPQLANPQLANLQLTNSPYADPSGDVIQNVTNYTWQFQNAGSTASAFTPVFNIANEAALAGKKTRLYIYNTYKTPVFIQTPDGCKAVEQPHDVIISVIENPQLANPQLANPQLANPQLANPQLANPQLANSTFYVAPSDSASSSGGTAAAIQRNLLLNVAFQTGTTDTDLTLTIPPPDTFITLQIQDGDTFQTGAPPPPPAPGEPPPPFAPPLTFDDFSDGTAALGVISEAAPVINGVVQPIVESVSTTADLVFASVPTVTPLSLQAGGLVTVSPFDVTVVGNAPTAASGFRYGFYLSTTLEINPATAVFLGNLTHEGAIAPEEIVTLSGGTFAIPPNTVPGQYYVGVFLNDGAIYSPPLNPYLFESFANDTVSLALTIAAPVGPSPTSASDVGSTNEDVTLNVAAPGVLGNDGNAGAVTAVLSLGASHGIVTLNANGSYSYAPNSNYFGPDSFTYYATNGTLASPLATVVVTVASVNDAPSFTRGPDQNVAADTAISVPGWATNISAGAANEAGQTLNFIVTADNGSLFTSPPAIAPNGTLSLSTAHAAGSTTVHVRLHDNGGIEPGVDTSAEQTFTITVQPPLGPSANLQITQVRTPPNPTVGDTVTYTISVTNLGPDAADNVTVSDTYPAGLTWQSVASTVGTCGTGDLGNSCTLGTLANGAVATITMNYVATAAQPVSHTVTGATATTDPVSANDTSTDSAMVVYPPCAAPTFQGPNLFPLTGFDQGVIASTDFNHDGRADLAITMQSQNSVAIVLGGPPTPTYLNVGTNPTSIVTGDFNNDGNADLAIVNNGSANMSVLLGDGAGGFAPAVNYAVPALPFSNAVGDFNGDGNLDVVIGYLSSSVNTVAVLLGDGAGHFGAATTYASNQAPTNVIVADYDGDGKLDIAVPNTGVTTISLLRGNGSGGFAAPTTIALPNTVLRLRDLGDVNHDGRPDLGVTTGANTSDLMLLLNSGGGSFAAPVEIIPPSGIGFVIAGDFTGDGDPDLAAINFPSQRLLVLKGDGAGSFVQTASYAVAGVNHIQPIDVNGDGRPDIVGAPPGAFFVLFNECGNSATSDLTAVTASPANTPNGTQFSYTVDVTNHGPDVANSVVMTSVYPAGTTFVSASANAPGVTCTELNGNVTCSLASMAVGANVTFTVNLQAFAAGVRTFNASGTSLSADPNPGDNYASASTTVAAGAATFVVTTTADLGPGSLRTAINNSNLNTGSTNSINFAIAGTGPFTIAPASALPVITVPVVIDGTSQPNGVVTIDGGNTILEGLQINGGGAGSTIRGLQITHFNDGVFANGGSNSTIVGNTLTGNGFGIFIGGSSSNVKVGGVAAGDANTITGNGGSGVRIAGGTGNAVRGNSISGNGLLGVDLGPTGVTPNDAGDGDTGANNLQNFPVLTRADALSGVATVAGTLNSIANSTFAIDVFANSACDASGYGEGERFLGSLSATTDGNGNATFSTTFSGVSVGESITTTATDAFGSTSEFSACRPVTPGIVTTDFSSPIPSGESGSGFVGLDSYHQGAPAAQVLNTLNLGPSGKPNLSFPVVMAVLPAAGSEPGIGLFSANGRIGVLDLAAGMVTDAISVPGDPIPTIARANTTTRIAYFASGNRLVAIDGRSTQSTYKTPLLTTTIGTAIRALAVHESTGRVFVVSTTNVTNTNFTSAQITVIDGDPGSGTFHQVLNSVNLGSFGVNDAVLNPVTNKVYVADTAGLHVFNATSLAVTQVANVPAASSVVVNPTKNVVYASNGFNIVSAVDGSTDTRFTTFALTTTGAPSASGEGRLVIHNASGRVFYHYGDGPQSSRLVVIDGDPTHITAPNNTFNTVLSQTAAGWETTLSFMAIDQSVDRLVLHNYYTHTTTIIDALTSGTVATVTAPQGSGRPIAINPSTHTAYLSLGVGAIQIINIATGSAQIVPTGTETRLPVVDTTAHLAYVPRTGAETGLAVFSQGGLQTTISAPSGAGQFRFAERNATTDRIYAVNFAANTAGDHDAAPGSVSVINGSTKAVVATLAVGNRPASIAVDSVLNRVYVGNTSVLNDVSANYHSWAGITVIDGATNTATAANLDPIVASAISVNAMAVNTTTGRLYFRAQNGNNVGLAWLDPATNNASSISTTLGPIAQIKVNPVLNRVYVGTSDGRFHIIDGSTNTLMTTLNIGNAPGTSVGTLQNWIAVNKSTGRVYVADNNNDTVTVLDGSSNSIVATIANLEGPFAVAVNETSNRVYALDGGDDSLTVIDGATNKVLHALALPMNVVAMAVDDKVTPAHVYVVGDCPNGSGCTGSETGVMLVSDPIDPYGPITVTSVGAAAHGTATVNANGSLSYTSNAGYIGTDAFTYTVTDANGATATGTVTLNVISIPSITTTSLPSTTVGASYNQTLAVSGGTAPYRWSIVNGQLPAGLALDEATGKITGVPSNSGTYSVGISVQDAFGDDVSAQFSIIVGPPVVTTTSLPTATVNVPYSQPLAVGGATGAVTWTLNTNNSPLLTWLTVSPSGVLSGTPPSYGTTPSFTVTVTDSLNQSNSRALTLFVTGPLDIVQTTLREGVVMENNGQPAIPIVGGSGAKNVILTSGSLPPGITLNASGTFTGAPRTHGTFSFTVEVTDQSSPVQTITRTLTWRVSAREQQGATQTQSSISFGGPNGRKIAQTFTMAAVGKLTGVGSASLSCSLLGPVTVEIQRLTLAGVPDGTTIASGIAINNFSAISVNPPVDVAIDERLAFVWSSPTSCDVSNAPNTDTGYQSGDAYVDAGSGWVTLASTDGRYDVPFRTLIQPAADVVYFNAGRFDGANASPLAGGTKVLITGTDNTGDVYNETTNIATQTPALNTPVPAGFTTQRFSHTSTLLNDGAVLIAGGRNSTGTSTRLASAETYNSTTNTYTLTTGSMLQGRESAAAVKLPNGKVLIVGGFDGSQSLASVELYDPSTRSFSSAGTMTTARNWPTVVLLNNGKVLIAGGYINSVNGNPTRNAEIYDPATGTFAGTVGPMALPRGRSTGTLLSDGRVLITGGQNADIRADAEVYNPITDSFAATSTPMTSARFAHAATALPDGTVLISGGYDSQNVNGYILPLATLERYMPSTNSFVAAGSMEVRRASHESVALADGKVLLVGGTGANGWFIGDTGELYDVAKVPSLTTTTLPDGQVGSPYPSTILNAGGGAGGPYTIALAYGVLPSGMNYGQATATLSGTPGSTGAFQLGFRVTDGSGNTNVQTLTLKVGTVPVITSASRLVDGAVSRPYSVQLTANATAPLTWSNPPGTSSMPPGLSISSSGVISGTPTSTGFYNFIIRLIDGTGQSVFKSFAISITNPLVITTASLPELAVLENTSGCFSILNGFGTKSWSLTSTPSTGISILSNGCLAPTAIGTYQISAQVTDQSSPPQVVSANFNVRVSAREQQAFTTSGSTTAFGGGSGGRIIAQTITVGASGTLTAVGFNSSTNCSGAGMTVNVQGVTLDGRPDGNSIASGFTTGSLAAIALGSGVPVTVGQRLALVVNASAPCTTQNNDTRDYYQAGDAFVSTGSGWVPLLSTDGRYDFPLRTLIQPSAPLTYLNNARSSAVIALSNSGKVLFANGSNADVYDANTGTVTPTGNPVFSFFSRTSAVLNDGSVLIAGGSFNGNRLATAQTWDPSTGTFTATANNLSVARDGAAAVKLPSGKVLIVGGNDGVTSSAAADLYDPATRTFTALPDMVSGRNSPIAVLLDNGKVLIAGGYISGPKSAELYDPLAGPNGTFTATVGDMVSFGRGVAAAAKLGDGRVLITGGQWGDVLDSAEVYDPVTDTFSATPNMGSRRYLHTATTLADGSVLIAGGDDAQSFSEYTLPLATLERYFPATNTWASAGSMVVRRQSHGAVRLSNGKVLLVGGDSQSWLTNNSAELYDVASTPVLSPSTLPNGQVNVAYPTTTLSGSGGDGGPYTITQVSGALPSGMTFNAANRQIAGTPTLAGVYTAGFNVATPSGSSVQSLTITVGNLLTITSPYRLVDAAFGQPYSVQLQTANATPPVVWSLTTNSALPPNLSLSSSGLIAGTITASGYYNFAVRATDASGQSVVKVLSIAVDNPLTITTTSMPIGIVGWTPTCLNANNGVGARTWIISTGALPAGLTLQSNGCFSGWPTAVGTFNFEVQVTDSASPPEQQTQPFTWLVAARDQIGWNETQPAITFGGQGGRTLAQTFTIGATGVMNGVGLYNLSCAAPLNVAIQRLDVAGLPDGHTLATGNASSIYESIQLSAGIPVGIGEQFAMIVSSTGLCSILNVPAQDFYDSGEAYSNTGSQWVPLRSSDGRYDLGFHNLIQPSAAVDFINSRTDGATATLLTNGKVLLAGSNGKTADLYDPATRTSTPTGMMVEQRWGNTATRLGSGKVLIVGGTDASNNSLKTAELYDPSAGTFAAVPSALVTGRTQHTATLLNNGRVLIAGGILTNGPNSTGVNTIELYDPASNSFIGGPTMLSPRWAHTATLLNDGRVLIAGGYGSSVTAELYDPAQPSTDVASAGNMIQFRGQHAATLLTDGRVLLSGGDESNPAAELFDPVTNTFTATGTMTTTRKVLSAERLSDGSVLIVGGQTEEWGGGWYTVPTATMERYRPASGTFVPAGSMEVRRYTPQLVTSGSTVLIIGGYSQSWMSNDSIEFYQLGSVPALATTSLPGVQSGSPYPTTTLTATGGSGSGYQIALVSGVLPNGTMTYDAPTATLSGTPTQSGSFTLGFRITDGASHTNFQSLTFRVDGLTITSPYFLGNGNLGQPFPVQLTASAPATWRVMPESLPPPGLTLNSNGVFVGTPTATGYYGFTVEATGPLGQKTQKSMAIFIQ